MNNLYRSLISLATVFPLSITFSYLYSDWLLSLLPDVVSHFLEAHLNAQLVFVFARQNRRNSHDPRIVRRRADLVQPR